MDGKKKGSHVFSNGMPVIDSSLAPPPEKTPQQERLTELLNDKDVVCAVNGLALQVRETYDNRSTLQDIDLKIYTGLVTVAPNYTASMLKSGNWETPSIVKEAANESTEYIKALPAETQEKAKELLDIDRKEFPYRYKFFEYVEAHPDDFTQTITAALDGLNNKKTPGCPER